MKIALTKDGNTWEGIQKGICVDFFLNGKNRGITGCENLLFAQKELIDVVNKKIKEGFIFDKKMKIQFDNFKNKYINNSILSFLLIGHLSQILSTIYH